MSNGRPLVDLIGKTFGKFTVIGGPVRSQWKSKRHLWLCRCSCGCGKEKLVSGGNLVSGKARGGHIKHGFKRRDKQHPLYVLWSNMRNRCNNKNEKSYQYYGGRGIKVCSRWDDFVNFKNDMGKRPSKTYSIDRIDNSGNYCPENCRWSTDVEQANNMTTNIMVSYKGKRMTLKQFAACANLPYPRVRFRYHKGLSLSEIIKTKLYFKRAGIL